MADNELTVNTHITGDLPRLQPTDQVIYPDFSQQFVYKSNLENPGTRKIVESQGSLSYLLVDREQPQKARKFRIEHRETIHFSVCGKVEEEERRQQSGLTKLMTKRLMVAFTDGQVRYTSANYVRSLMAVGGTGG